MGELFEALKGIQIPTEVERIVNEADAYYSKRTERKSYMDFMQAKIKNLEAEVKELQAQIENLGLGMAVPNTAPQASQQLSAIREQILLLVFKNKNVSTEDLARACQMEEETMRYHLEELKTLNFVSDVYYDDGIHWYVNQPGRKYLDEQGKL